MKHLKNQFLSIFVFAILFISNSPTIFSQNCKFTTNTKDKFTDEVEKELESVLLLKHYKKGSSVKISDLSMILGIKGDKNIFTLSLSLSGKMIPTFNKFMGNKLILLLENGNKIELPMTGGATADIIKTDMFAHFKINKDDLETLSKVNITDIRVIAQINAFDFTVDMKVKTSQYFKCIL